MLTRLTTFIHSILLSKLQQMKNQLTQLLYCSTTGYTKSNFHFLKVSLLHLFLFNMNSNRCRRYCQLLETYVRLNIFAFCLWMSKLQQIKSIAYRFYCTQQTTSFHAIRNSEVMQIEYLLDAMYFVCVHQIDRINNEFYKIQVIGSGSFILKNEN